MWKNRAKGWLIFTIICLFFLIGRLIQIQLWKTENFSSHHVNLLEESVEQRTQELLVDNGRGIILDRNNNPMTFETKPVLVLFPFLKNMDWNSKDIAEIIGVSEKDIIKEVNQAKEPFALGDPTPVVLTTNQMNEINNLKIPGVFAVVKQYSKSGIPAAQLVGVIGENEELLRKRYPDKDLSGKTLIGLTGLQAAFDEFLLPEGEAKLVYHVDAKGAPLFGIDVKYADPANPYYPVNIKTTIDINLQTMTENLVDQYNIKNGGIVLLDIESNEIRALVSRPNIIEEDPFKNNGVKNLMLKPQIMGSIFKTVVAAAAMDYQLDDLDRKFDCNKKINGELDNNYQHGLLTFEESFARSCNRTFGDLAKKLKSIDPEILERYAERLGLLGPNGWIGNVFHLENFKQFPEEEKGRVFLTNEARNDDNYVALSGIGQHEVRANPLAVANMMATIARGGKRERIKVVSELQYQNDSIMYKFKEKEIKGDPIAPYTAMKLQKLLREVVVDEKGTGRWFQDLPYEVAGKSGTAETGIFENNKQLHNKWFAGYFPFKQPKYALVVVNLSVNDQEGGINPLFADIVKNIHEYEER